MKHAVILAHPKATSFNASIARICVETLRAMGHEVIERDLYAIDFDPRLQAQEIPSAGGFQAAPDVVAERKRLADVDSFIFVYPFWFNAPPAILKGYVDRVFAMGFGYAPGIHGAEPLLSGKTLMSFSTSGAPDQWVNSSGALTALMTVFDHHVGAVCGLRLADHEHFGGIASNMAQEPADDILDQVRAALHRVFDPPG